MGFFTKLHFSLWWNGEIFELGEITYSQACEQCKDAPLAVYQPLQTLVPAWRARLATSDEGHEKVCKTFILSKPNCCPLPYHQNNNSHFPRLLIFNIPILHPENSPSLILSASCACKDIWPWPAWAFELSFTYNADMSRNGSVYICIILYLKYLLKYGYSIPPRFSVVNQGSNH